MNLLQPGQIFAERYRIERLLAKGGFGVVYVAEQIATELSVALKVLWPHVLASTDAVEKFKLEARVASRVNSEHIVRVFDAGLDPKSQMPFLVMELLEGKDLERLVHTSGALSSERAVLYLSHVAAALDKAHGYVDRAGVPRPIVHRDLKPENLFLTHRENGEPIVKVLDFGIAKVLGSASDVSREIKGTPLFMAFEQMAVQPVTPKTDVWALGLIAFYLLTGQHYWNATRTPDAALTALFGEVLSLPLAAPSERLRELRQPPLPPAFDSWFFQCVNRDPALRFASAGAAILALASIFQMELPSSSAQLGMAATQAAASSASGPGVAAIAVSALQTGTENAVTLSRSGGGRKGVGVPLLMALALILVIGGTVLAWRSASAPREEATATAAPEASYAAPFVRSAEPPPQHASASVKAPASAAATSSAAASAGGSLTSSASSAAQRPVPRRRSSDGWQRPTPPKESVFDER